MHPKSWIQKPLKGELIPRPRPLQSTHINDFAKIHDFLRTQLKTFALGDTCCAVGINLCQIPSPTGGGGLVFFQTPYESIFKFKKILNVGTRRLDGAPC